MRVIADDMTYNLKNDKAFAELRSKLKGTRKGTQAAKLYKEARSLTSGLRSIDKDLHNQYANLTTKQKVKLMQDYSNHDLMEKVIDYELATTVGANLTNSIKKFRATAEGLSIDASSVAKTVQDDVSSMITKFHNAIYANLTGIQKQAQHWILAGGLIDWAKAVNENFKNDTKKGIKFLKSPSSKSFKAKAFKSYLHYKEQTILDAFKKDEAEEIKAKDPIFYNNLARDRRDMLRGYKDYRIEKTYFKRQWQAWGRSDGKTALTAYDITFSVHFDVNTTTTPPKVTCTSLSKSEEKKQNNTIRTKKVGDRLFMRLMWTQLLLQLFEGNSPKAVSRRDRFIKYDVNADRIASGIGKGLGALEAKFKASPKISVFFSSHILLRDLIKLEHAFETPKRVFTRINQEFKRVNKAIQRESDFIKLLRQPVSVFSKKNFFRIESYKTNSLKILKLQAALAFDFDDTINNKGVKQIDTSRYDYMKKQAKSQDHTLSADYKKDMGAERAGDNLTIGQVLVSLEPGSTKDLGPVSEPTRNSSHSINNSVPSNNPVPKKGKFWKKLPQQKASNPADKKTATANLMLLWRNYKLVKHLSNKKSKAKELDDTAAKKADDDGLDFDSLTSQEIDTASRRVNREATRLDDDFDYLKGEFEVDEKAAENAIEAETEAIENQVLYEAEHGVVDKSDDLLPNNNILESARVETEEFGNSVIETTKKGKEYIGEDIEATEGEAALEAGAAEDIVGEAVML
jgi:hypothetical protein